MGNLVKHTGWSNQCNGNLRWEGPEYGVVRGRKCSGVGRQCLWQNERSAHCNKRGGDFGRTGPLPRLEVCHGGDLQYIEWVVVAAQPS